ncbi:MAG: tetratricopeptide repeat protein, partial [Calditrichia bacterium]
MQDFYTVNQNVGVNKLARLIGRVLAQENVQRLKLELAHLYLEQLKDIPETIRICESVIAGNTDSSLVGQAYFLMGKSYQRLAALEEFRGEKNLSNAAKAETALKDAMGYLNAIPEKDSLSYAFLEETTSEHSAEQIPLDKKIKFWNHFVSSYPDSRLADRARLILADLNLQAGDAQNALIQLNAAKGSANPDLAGTAYFKIADIYFRQNDLAKATEYLKDFLLNIQVHPLRAKAFARLAGISETQGDYKSASQLWA